MKVCLVSPSATEVGAPGHSVVTLAEALATRHEVVLIRSGVRRIGDAAEISGVREVWAVPSADLETLKFACEDHLYGAAVVDAIRAAYGDEGPDYLEVPDFRAHGLVALQARLGGEPLLAGTKVGVRASCPTELASLHDRALSESGRRWLADLEREQLRLADHLIVPPGDTGDLYRRHFRTAPLPEPVKIPPPPANRMHFFAHRAKKGVQNGVGGALRILYVGELRRRNGVLDLVEACLALPLDDWELTLVGDDTPTAAMGQSARLTIEAMAGGDPRLRFETGEPRWAEHDLLVVPSRFEPWGATAIAGIGAGLPVLATPVGGLVAIVEDSVSGWLTDGIGPAPLARALDRLLNDRDEVDRVRASDALAVCAATLTDPAPTLALYDHLFSPGHPGSTELTATQPSPSEEHSSFGVWNPTPLVTGVVPYFRASAYVAEAVASLLGQTHPRIEVVIVNDGSFEPADAVLEELAADPRVRLVNQPNGGESAARRLGALLADGEYLAMLDADNLLEPTFVARALGAFDRQPELSYVTCWLRMIGPDGGDTRLSPGYAALGNGVLSSDEQNWDGDTISLRPRRAAIDEGFGFDPESAMHSDWELYRRLRGEGRFGLVIPERLARYRVLPDSLMRGHGRRLQERGWAESLERNEMRKTRWVARGGGGDG